MNVTLQLKLVYGALQFPGCSLLGGEQENLFLRHCEPTNFHQSEMHLK